VPLILPCAWVVLCPHLRLVFSCPRGSPIQLGFLQAESFLPWSSVSVCTGFFLSRAGTCGKAPSGFRVFHLTFFVRSGFDSYSDRAASAIEPQLFFPLEFSSAVCLSAAGVHPAQILQSLCLAPGHESATVLELLRSDPHPSPIVWFGLEFPHAGRSSCCGQSSSPPFLFDSTRPSVHEPASVAGLAVFFLVVCQGPHSRAGLIQ
jgi:hypothetical protein